MTIEHRPTSTSTPSYIDIVVSWGLATAVLAVLAIVTDVATTI